MKRSRAAHKEIVRLQECPGNTCILVRGAADSYMPDNTTAQTRATSCLYGHAGDLARGLRHAAVSSHAARRETQAAALLVHAATAALHRTVEPQATNFAT